MFHEGVITMDGLSLDTKIRAGLTTAKFTHVKFGNGSYSGSEDLNILTAMRSVRQSFGISSINTIDNKQVRLRVVANNLGITEGYYISELGVFAEDPDKGEILYSIALGIQQKMDYQPSEIELAGATGTFDIFTSVSNVESVVIEIGIGAAASAEDLEDLNRKKVNASEGDISATRVGSIDHIADNFPAPMAGESTKTFMGKVKKNLEDWKNLKEALVMLPQLRNMMSSQYLNDANMIPTSALVYALKGMVDQLNSDMQSKVDSNRIDQMAVIYYDSNNLVIADAKSKKRYITINMQTHAMVADVDGWANNYNLSSLIAK